jgi:hypothetical protein
MIRIVLIVMSMSKLVSCSEATRPSATTGTSEATGGTVIDFEKYEIGKTPNDWTPALTGGGGPVEWVVKEDASSPVGRKVLAQTSTDDTDNRFPVCTFNDFSAKDVDVSVRLKAVAGKVDQAGGLVVRFKDKDNYYITRANALEDNVRLYKVVNGSRKQFAGVNAKVSSGAWHTLRLVANGSHCEVFFDGKSLFAADDHTFKDAGRVGVWTKADSVTHFDDFRFLSRDQK